MIFFLRLLLLLKGSDGFYYNYLRAKKMANVRIVGIFN